MMSSQYGPNKLGYTGVTKVNPKGSKNVSWSKSQKNYLSTDCFLKEKHEAGIASNRKTACYGESVSRLSTHRPSRHGSLSIENR